MIGCTFRAAQKALEFLWSPRKVQIFPEAGVLHVYTITERTCLLEGVSTDVDEEEEGKQVHTAWDLFRRD